MVNILSIQSHVSYGYVGNKAATFPLQDLGLDVWPINTVQFSNHTGYDHCRGQVYSADHISEVLQGLEEQDLAKICNGILSGYIGDKSIGKVILNTVKNFKKINPNLVYLCDPVMGDIGGKKCFVEKGILPYFKEFLPVADIIAPNHYEAEILYGKRINNTQQLKQSANFFHQQGVKTIIIRNIKCNDTNKERFDFLSDKKTCSAFLATTPRVQLCTPINGSGDLFSALYLGIKLLGYSPLKAFKYAFNKTQEIIIETALSKQRELKIIGHNYCESPKEFAKLHPV